MKSSKMYHYIFKYGCLFFGLLIVSFALLSWFVPESTVINGETGARDFFTSFIFLLFGILLILLFLLTKDKFARVEMGNQVIRIYYRGEEININWLDIEKIHQIPMIYPPLYSLKSKHLDEAIWFTTDSVQFVNLGGFVSDLSEMGDLIKKKKRELGI